MKKTLLAAILMVSAFLPPTEATTVVFGAVPAARQVVDATNVNTLITDASSLVLAGTFANESFTLNSGLSLQANLASVISSGGWKQFGLDTGSGSPNVGVVTSLALNSSGRIGGSILDNNFGATQADFFNGKNLYLMVFNAVTTSASTQFGIYRATTATTSWIFPTNGGGLGDSTTYSTTPALATIAAIGNFGTTPTSKLQLTNNFNVAPVPEPATLAFGLLSFGAAICARRRRAEVCLSFKL